MPINVRRQSIDLCVASWYYFVEHGAKVNSSFYCENVLKSGIASGYSNFITMAFAASLNSCVSRARLHETRKLAVKQPLIILWTFPFAVSQNQLLLLRLSGWFGTLAAKR